MSDPYCDVDAERALLGAMLSGSRGVCESAFEILEPGGEKTFYGPSHSKIYAAIRSTYLSGVDPEFVSVSDQLPELSEEIHDLLRSAGATVNAPHWARIVRREWGRRWLDEAVIDMKETLDTILEPEEAAEALLRQIFAFSDTYESGRSQEETIKALMAQLSDRFLAPPAERGLSMPFKFMPRLHPGRVHVLAGYAGDGKSALAWQIAEHVARQGESVGFWSIEMSRLQLAERALASHGVPLRQVESGHLSQAHMATASQFLLELGALPIVVFDSTRTNAADIQRRQRSRKFSLIVVDHLHEIRLPGKASERRQALEDEVAAFVALARQEDVPVLLLAQLSRPREQGFPSPTLSMLRETARIEQLAHQVMFIYRKRNEDGTPKDEAKLIIAKNRSGQTGDRALMFRGAETRFLEVHDER